MSERIFAELDVAVAERALPGEARSGDRAVVLPRPGGALLAAIDGLGHGDAAADAADRAERSLREGDSAELDTLFQACHQALLGTRGAAVTLVALDFRAPALTWFGVGNVDGRLLPLDESTRPEAPMLMGGVVGYALPAIRPSTRPLKPGDTLLLATDGIDPAFASGPRPVGSTRRIAEAILAGHAKDSDDALVLVARFRGPGAPPAAT